MNPFKRKKRAPEPCLHRSITAGTNSGAAYCNQCGAMLDRAMLRHDDAVRGKFETR